MKALAKFILFIMLSSSFLFAGEIYGDIKKDGEPIVQAEVEIVVGDKIYPKVNLDKYGSYSIYVEEEGECELIVHYRGQRPSIKVHSYEGSVRYNLVLEEKEGKYYLRRD